MVTKNDNKPTGSVVEQKSKLRCKKLFLTAIGVLSLTASGQSISMDFPKFAGKTYMFLLFQGSTTIKEEGIIPESGKFTLTVPEHLSPYTGMCRWLLTNSPDGGGLDMTLEGKDYAVSCRSDHPADADIIYTGNDETAALNKLHQEEQIIFSKYNAMALAAKSYDKSDKLQATFLAEMKKQQEHYAVFQNKLRLSPNYSAKFINIVNITQDIGTELHADDTKRVLNMANFITHDLNWDALFTSGHWSSVITAWLNIHLGAIKDASKMRLAFITITGKLKTPEMYEQFTETITAEITRQGRDDLIEMLAPLIIGSGKIQKYENNLAVYEKGKPGNPAPDLIIDESANAGKTWNSSEFAGEGFENTLLIFYQTGCSHCDDEMKKLDKEYKKLSSEKIRIIAIAADTEESIFKKNAASFPWKDTYADYKGFEADNFKNYGVRGTPSIFLINKDGIIIKRAATVEDALDNKQP